MTADICLGAVPATNGSNEWRALGYIMSDLSESFYCAGWMQHTEYAVYRLMTEGGLWGMGDARDAVEELGVLRGLSERLQVWVTWCDAHGEEPMPLDRWKDLYAQWRATRDYGTPDEQRAEFRHNVETFNCRMFDRHEYDDGDAAQPGDLCIWCLAPKPDVQKGSS